MEKNKLDSMCKLIKEGKASSGYYVNFIGNKAYLFSIHKICAYLKKQKASGKTIYYNRLLPKTTSGNTEKVWKKIVELPLDLAVCVTLNTESDE